MLFSRPLAVAAFKAGLGLSGALLAAGCADPGAGGSGTATPVVLAVGGGVAGDQVASSGTPFYASAAGYYLAARQAEEDGDRVAATNFIVEALKRDPGNFDLLHDTFELLLGEGRIAEADPLAQRLIATPGGSQMASILLAVEEVRDGAWAQSAARMSRLPKLGIATVAAPLIQAWALAGDGEPDQAIKTLDQLSSVRGFAVLRDFHAALMEDFAGQVGPAEADYKKALVGETSSSFRVVDAFANFYARHGRSQDALALFAKFAEGNPETVRVQLTVKSLQSGTPPAPRLRGAKDGLAEALFDLGSALRQDAGGALALQFLRLSLVLEPDLDIARMSLADMLEADRRDDEALALFRGIAPTSSLYFAARLRVADVLRDDDKLDEAVKELEALAAKWPAQTEPLATEGDFLRSADRFDEAVKAYDRAIARIGTVGPTNWPLFYARGVALERAGNWPSAEQDFLQALKLSPDQPSVLNYLGYSWVDRGLNLDQARGMIERAVQLRPNDGYIVDSLGWVLYREGHYQSAVTHLERAVELKPDDPVINDHLGDAYWRVGRLTEARFQWKRALTLRPEPDLVTQIGAKLDHGLTSGKTGEHDS